MIYLDHAATSLPRSPNAFAAAVRAGELATPGRGLHSLQAEAAAACEGARDAVGRLLPSGYVVAFMSGATAALSQAIFGLRPRPSVVATDPLAHNAVRRPLARLARDGSSVWTLPHHPRSGLVDLERTTREWNQGTTLVVVTHGSNVTGLLQPVDEIVRIAHARGAKVIVDAAQTAGVIAPLNVGDADMVAFSAHKGIGALPGVGVLAVRGSVDIEPLVVGGSGFDSLADDVPAELPARLEAGTPNLPGIVAVGAAAVDVVQSTYDYRDRTRALLDAIRRGGVESISAGDLPIALILWPNAPSELEDALDRVYGIVTRAGTHCAPQAHAVIGTNGAGALRVSAGRTTTDSELTTLSLALRDLARSIGKTS